MFPYLQAIKECIFVLLRMMARLPLEASFAGRLIALEFIEGFLVGRFFRGGH